MNIQWRNQVVLLTGATGGIGQAIAKALDEKGAHIILTGRSKAKLEQLQQNLTLHHTAIVADITSDEGKDRVVSACQRLPLSILVNNAGITEGAAAKNISPERFREVLNINLVAPWVLARAVQPVMKVRGGGVIINVGSTYGSIGVANNSPYCSSKAGIEGLTRALAREWARDQIRVICVAPGFVKTDMVGDNFGGTEVEELVVSRIPMKRFGEAEEIAQLIAFLSTSKAGFVTGETLVIDGGQRALI